MKESLLEKYTDWETWRRPDRYASETRLYLTQINPATLVSVSFQ